MENEIIRGLYQKYLEELFEIDKTEKEDLTYIIKTIDDKYVVLRNGKKSVYDDVGVEYCGYMLVSSDKGKNFIDGDGNLLLKEWVNKATNFENGYACVQQGREVYFIDIKGEKVPHESLPIDMYSSRFCENGIGNISYNDRKSALMRKDGKLLFNKIFDIIEDFEGENAVAYNYNDSRLKSDKDKNYKEYHIISSYGNDINLKYKYSHVKQVAENIFIAKENKKYILIDSTGERIGNIEFDTCPYYGFRNGYLIIVNEGKSNLLTEDGNLLYKKWYDSVDISYDGFSVIRENGKYNYLDKDENLLSTTWFDYAKPFNGNNAVIKLNDKEQIIDNRGDLKSEVYDEIFYSYKGYRVVRKDEKYNIIGEDGKTLSDKWVNYSHNVLYENNLRYVENEENQANYIDLESNPALSEWKEHLTSISNGFFGSYENNSLIIYDLDGNKIDEIENIQLLEKSSVPLSVILEPKKVKEPLARKKWFSYEYNDGESIYSLGGKPIVDYGEIILYNKNDDIFIYEKKSRRIYPIGTSKDTKIEVNYIEIGDKKYYVSGTNLIDISHIEFKRKIELKQGIDKIKTLQEFKELCSSNEYQEIINNELKNARKRIEEERKRKINEDLLNKQEAEKKLLEEKNQNIKKSLSELSEILAECSKYLTEIQGKINENQNEKVEVPEELLLIQVDDHYEFNPIFLTKGILRFIDLRNISLSDVKISGVDLSYTNANINPQEVYNKDMSNGKFCGIDFNLCDFRGVNTTNADFTDAIMDFAIKENNTK